MLNDIYIQIKSDAEKGFFKTTYIGTDPLELIEEVAAKLRDDGYNTKIDTYGAYGEIEIKWSYPRVAPPPQRTSTC